MKRLERTACTLARFGHANVWNYPWGVFQAAIDELNEAMKEAKK